MRHFTQKISVDGLREKIDAAEDKTDGYVSFDALTTKIQKDLSKVQFDSENYDPCDVAPHTSDGYLVLDNGLTVFGVISGGDWEWPLYYIIYFDGKHLRGYVPKDGNPWNTTTKTAYGNGDDAWGDDENADITNAKQRGFVSDDVKAEHIDDLDIKYDWTAIFADICSHIVVKEPEDPSDPKNIDIKKLAKKFEPLDPGDKAIRMGDLVKEITGCRETGELVAEAMQPWIESQ